MTCQLSLSPRRQAGPPLYLTCRVPLRTRGWLRAMRLSRLPASRSLVLHRRAPVPVGVDGLHLLRGAAPCHDEPHRAFRFLRFLR